MDVREKTWLTLADQEVSGTRDKSKIVNETMGFSKDILSKIVNTSCLLKAKDDG